MRVETQRLLQHPQSLFWFALMAENKPERGMTVCIVGIEGNGPFALGKGLRGLLSHRIDKTQYPVRLGQRIIQGDGALRLLNGSLQHLRSRIPKHPLKQGSKPHVRGSGGIVRVELQGVRK